MEYVFLLGRVLLGGYFLMNSYNHFKNAAAMAGYAQSKGVPMPKLAVIATGVLLLIGGLGILTGIFVAIALLCIALFLIGVTFTMHQYWKVADPMAKMGEQINFYKNLALLGAILMLLTVPAAWWAFPLLY